MVVKIKTVKLPPLDPLYSSVVVPDIQSMPAAVPGSESHPRDRPYRDYHPGHCRSASRDPRQGWGDRTRAFLLHAQLARNSYCRFILCSGKFCELDYGYNDP